VINFKCFFHHHNIESLAIALAVVILIVIYYLLQQEINRRKQAEIILRQQTDKERLVNQISQHIRQTLNLEDVLIKTVAEVKEFLECDRVLIYRIWDDGTGTAITETVTENYPIILGQSFPAEVFPREYHQAYTQGKIRTITNVDTENIEECLVEFIKQFGVKAKLVVPILQADHLWGLLIAHHCQNPREWQPLEIELMKQLATQVAIAIQQSELYEQLQELNTELELRVQQRTEELAQANQQLRATNHTLKALISASPRGIFTLDLEGNVKIWNPEAERIFGWTEAEVTDKPSSIITPITLLEYRIIAESLLEEVTFPTVELRCKKKDGSLIDISLSAAGLKDSQDQITGVVAVVADITEQKRQEEQLRLLQSVVINTNDAVMITEAEPIEDPGPRILYVNEAFTRITGYTLAEVQGKNPRFLQGINTDQEQLKKVRNALENVQAITGEVINYRKNGSEFWNEFSIVPVADKNGRYTHWISVQRDITERRKAEAELRISEERFRSLIENALDVITIINSDGIIYYISPSVEKVLGYTAIELVNKNIFEYIDPDDIPNVLHNFTNAIQNNHTALSIEFRCRHKDHSWRILEAISQKFIDHGENLRIVINSRDITERKRLDEIRLALEREKELSALKIRFFSMASHEFRTPLSTILAAAHILESCEDGETIESQKKQRNIHRVKSSVKNMIQLLDDILTINRAETGKLEFNPKEIDLEIFCLNLVEEIRLSMNNQHHIIFTSPSQGLTAYLDEKLLRSIITNLLSNALKYSPQGSNINFNLDGDNNHIILRIKDQGIGITNEDKKRLFEPFHRGKNVRNIPGTGLGLVVVKKCVELHSGTINVQSEIGLETTFTVTLPF
jgi:PAS domain S-box-containing protein